ncbi:MAG: hypothetical protein NTW86_22085 [Candidatus Sumerlaeota bacterium]|nr:hypothetical protein [Candidatus Sumerlaeota bacterium]
MRAIRETVTVEPDGVLRVRSPELPCGASVEVIVLVPEGVANPESAPTEKRSLRSLFGSGRGCFKSVEEVDEYLRNLRGAPA